jgi:hypothetical protein
MITKGWSRIKIFLEYFSRIPNLLELCYTVKMEADQHIWRYWVENIQRWGGAALAASLLEAFGTFGTLLAQLAYICQPAARLTDPDESLSALARLLEDGSNRQAFIGYLRGEGG